MKKILFIPFFVLFIFGCTGSIASHNDFSTFPYKGISNFDANKALVCIYRPWHFLSCGSLPFVFKDEQIIGVLKNGSYFLEESDPGQYSYYIELGGAIGGKVRISVLMELESGERYFIVYRNRLERLVQVSQNLAMTEIEGLKYTEIKKKTYSK